MRALLRCLPIVGVGALATGFLALPGPEERITMLLRDGEVLGLIDRDAASEIAEWDATDEIDALLEEKNDEEDEE